MKRIITIISLFLVFALSVNLTGCRDTTVTEATREGHARTEPNALGSLESFSFSLTWDNFGISSYDSATGTLIKTWRTTRPDDYITTYQLTEEEKLKIYDLIASLDILSYPDDYSNDEAYTYAPFFTIILSVKTDTVEKTITAENLPPRYASMNKQKNRFLVVCKEISDILTATEEWEALPPSEFYHG